MNRTINFFVLFFLVSFHSLQNHLQSMSSKNFTPLDEKTDKQQKMDFLKETFSQALKDTNIRVIKTRNGFEETIFYKDHIFHIYVLNNRLSYGKYRLGSVDAKDHQTLGKLSTAPPNSINDNNLQQKILGLCRDKTSGNIEGYAEFQNRKIIFICSNYLVILNPKNKEVSWQLPNAEPYTMTLAQTQYNVLYGKILKRLSEIEDIFPGQCKSQKHCIIL